MGVVCELVYRQPRACAAPFPYVAHVQRKDCPKCTFLSPQRTPSVHNLAAYMLPMLIDAEVPVSLGVGMPVPLDVGIREADGKDGGRNGVGAGRGRFMACVGAQCGCRGGWVRMWVFVPLTCRHAV